MSVCIRFGSLLLHFRWYSMREQGSVFICDHKSSPLLGVFRFLTHSLSSKPYWFEMRSHLADEKTEVQRIKLHWSLQSRTLDLEPFVFFMLFSLSFLPCLWVSGSLVHSLLGRCCNSLGVILLAAVGFYFGFIFGPFALHLSPAAQLCIGIDAASSLVFLW